jgi:hypothetical protein
MNYEQGMGIMNRGWELSIMNYEQGRWGDHFVRVAGGDGSLTGVGILQLRGRGAVKSINGGGRERTPTMKVNRQTFQ